MGLNISNIMTGLQIGGVVAGGLGAVAVTKSLLSETKELMPYALGGIGLIGSIVLIIKFA
jgi:hypothetical protein